MKILKRRAAKQPSPKRKAVLMMPVKPADEAAAHQARVRSHIESLRSINAAYAESMLEAYRDSELSHAGKKALIRKNARQAGAAVAEWHCQSLELVAAGDRLRSNLAGLHAELQRTLANFGAPWTN